MTFILRGFWVLCCSGQESMPALAHSLKIQNLLSVYYLEPNKFRMRKVYRRWGPLPRQYRWTEEKESGLWKRAIPRMTQVKSICFHPNQWGFWIIPWVEGTWISLPLIGKTSFQLELISSSPSMSLCASFLLRLLSPTRFWAALSADILNKSTSLLKC